MKYMIFLVLAAGTAGFAEGVNAFRDGRFQQALDSFSRTEGDAGHDASAELLYNKALAALCAGELLEAETSAEMAAARGGVRFRNLRDFIAGNAAFQRCERALEATVERDVQPSAFDAAIVHAEAARDSWQLAAASRSDWPEARRNVERALRKLAELRQKREESRQRQQEKKQKKKPEPPMPEPDSPGSEQKTRKAAPLLNELAPHEVLRLFDKLEEKQEEKLGLRRSERRKEKDRVEKDW